MKRPESVREKCLSDCPLECDILSFDLNVAEQAYLPTRELENSYAQTNRVYSNTTYSGSFGENIAGVSIYYDRLEYMSLTEAVKTDLVQLMSNLAGLAGLFLGMSILSVIEFVDLGLQIGFCLRDEWKTKRSLRKAKNQQIG